MIWNFIFVFIVSSFNAPNCELVTFGKHFFCRAFLFLWVGYKRIEQVDINNFKEDDKKEKTHHKAKGSKKSFDYGF